jgi:predicted nucleotidyltransferase component of viral defense system
MVLSMLGYDELLAYKIYEEPYQQEKDYIEELFLSRLFNSCNNIVFKGGTALAKFYGSNRFSDDLDFSIVLGREEYENIKIKIDKVIKRSTEEDPVRILRELNSERKLVYELSIRGPLFERSNKYQHLKIEIGKKEPVLEKPLIFRRNPKYVDIAPYTAIVMNEKEILAEKTVALLYRQNLKARDLYDIYFLLSKGTEIDVPLLDRKMKMYRRAFNPGRFKLRINKIALIWNEELERLLPKNSFISYAVAKEKVSKLFEDAGLI